MEISEEKKQIIREAIHIIHDICAERCECRGCPFNNKDTICAFEASPDGWPLSKKTSADWNYLDECEEEENE